MTTSLAPCDDSIESLKSIAEELLGGRPVSLESIDGGRNLALASYALYFATAAMLILGMVASHVPQHRL